ncbi:MAG: hypothetical protein L0227_03255 [Chloroflexi bacterium]|nr:hypothetical protein [Chloroflexota bacterium]
MSSSRLPLALAVVAVVAVLGGFLVFQQFLAGDDVARLTLAPVATASTRWASMAERASAITAASTLAGGSCSGWASRASRSTRL